jgi:TusA-related sulfurtransferase
VVVVAEDTAMDDAAGKVLVLDVSNLEPPQPMIAILEKIQELGPREVLEVFHHREPIPLYSLLEEAGFTHEIEKLDENHYRLTIQRKNDS